MYVSPEDCRTLVPQVRNDLIPIRNDDLLFLDSLKKYLITFRHQREEPVRLHTKKDQKLRKDMR